MAGRGYVQAERAGRCLAHSIGYTFIASASVSPALGRPSRIASTVAGASSVSLSTRETYDGLIFSALAISLMIAYRPVSSIFSCRKPETVEAR